MVAPFQYTTVKNEKRKHKWQAFQRVKGVTDGRFITVYHKYMLEGMAQNAAASIQWHTWLIRWKHMDTRKIGRQRSSVALAGRDFMTISVNSIRGGTKERLLPASRQEVKHSPVLPHGRTQPSTARNGSLAKTKRPVIQQRHSANLLRSAVSFVGSATNEANLY